VIFVATADGWLDIDGRRVRCALGPAGVVPAAAKREGDGASPAGVWPIREIWYRPDRGPPPACEIRVHAMTADDGWCDDPADPAYNTHVKLPYAASAERLWRDDGVYDIVVVLGHNDDPPVAGMGSAIFLHICRPGFPPTEGCVAIERPELEALLDKARPGDAVEIRQVA
jgi:L,D-peptidoglycan transpeptidase YkuD (ErfK/YbiS/YcfS/YnhG family)